MLSSCGTKSPRPRAARPDPGDSSGKTVTSPRTRSPRPAPSGGAAAPGGSSPKGQRGNVPSPEPFPLLSQTRPHVGQREGPSGSRALPGAQVARDTARVPRERCGGPAKGLGGGDPARLVSIVLCWTGGSVALKFPRGNSLVLAGMADARGCGCPGRTDQATSSQRWGGGLPWPRSCSGTEGGGCVDTLVAQSPRC